MGTSQLTRILAANDKKKTFTLLISGSEFRPSGGGQPGDRGELRADDLLFRVLESDKHPEGLAVAGTLVKGRLEPGMTFEEVVDLDLRAAYSRMHTGEHIISKVLEANLPSLRIEKVAIGEAESLIYLTYPGVLGWEDLFAAEDRANEIVSMNLPVEIANVGRAEGERLPGVRGKWERIADETIRVVTIQGFDAIACSGSHVGSTGEVGDILVTGYKGSPPNWEIRYITRGRAQRNEYSRVARRLARSVGCPADRLEGVLSSLREENAALGRTLERASQLVAIPWESSNVGGLPLFFSVLPGVPRELVTVASRSWSDDNPDALVLLLMPEAEGKGGYFLFYRGKEVDRDFSSFLRESPSLAAKGGGRSDWLNGASPCMRPEEWREAIARFLST